VRRWTDVSSTSTIRVPFARRRGFAVVPLLLIAPFVVVWLTGSSALAAASTTTALHDSCGYDHSPGNAPTASRYYAAPGPSSLSGFNFVSAMAARSGATIDRLPSLTGPCFATNSGSGASSAANGARLNSRLTAEEIAGGHSFEKHVATQAEFPGIRTRGEFADMIENVVNNYGDIKHLSGGRTAYWRDGVVVIRNPAAVDGGTAFVPRDGYAYFEGL